MDTLNQVAGQLGIDQSFYYLLGLMFLLNFILSKVYLRPFQHLLHERKEKTALSQKGSQELGAKVDLEMEKYREKMRALNQEVSKLRLAALEVAKKEESVIVAGAGDKAKSMIQNAQKELTQERKAVSDSIAGDLTQIAAQIATKVLGRPCQN